MRKGVECLLFYPSLRLQGIKSRSPRIALELGVNLRTRNREMKTATFLRNVGKQLSNHTAQQPERPAVSTGKQVWY